MKRNLFLSIIVIASILCVLFISKVDLKDKDNDYDEFAYFEDNRFFKLEKMFSDENFDYHYFDLTKDELIVKRVDKETKEEDTISYEYRLLQKIKISDEYSLLVTSNAKDNPLIRIKKKFSEDIVF